MRLLEFRHRLIFRPTSTASLYEHVQNTKRGNPTGGRPEYPAFIASRKPRCSADRHPWPRSPSHVTERPVTHPERGSPHPSSMTRILIPETRGVKSYFCQLANIPTVFTVCDSCQETATNAPLEASHSPHRRRREGLVEFETPGLLARPALESEPKLYRLMHGILESARSGPRPRGLDGEGKIPVRDANCYSFAPSGRKYCVPFTGSCRRRRS